jgi:hypothetical protein
MMPILDWFDLSPINLIKMKTSLLREKQFVGMLYGLTAGLAFALFAWGLDAVLLTSAHGALPWTKFLPGLILCPLAGSLIGWLTIRFENHLLAVGLWTLLALLFSRLIVWLPLKVSPYIIHLLDRDLGTYLKYPVYDSLNQNVWFGFAAILIVALICGLLEVNMIEGSLFSSGSYAFILPLLMCFFGFALIGKTSDSLLNEPIREPVVAVDRLLQFALDNIDQDVDGMLARSMHLGATTTIKDYLPLERRLIMSNYDESFGQIDVLVDFSGIWVKCTAIYNQVTYCKPAVNAPGARFLNLLKLKASLPMKDPFKEVRIPCDPVLDTKFRFMLYYRAC